MTKEEQLLFDFKAAIERSGLAEVPPDIAAIFLVESFNLLQGAMRAEEREAFEFLSGIEPRMEDGWLEDGKES